MSVQELAIVGPAFLAGLLVLMTHVPLGAEVLNRGIIFIDLAIAQVAGLGVIAADRAGLEAEGWLVQASAVSAALLAAVVLNWTDRRWPKFQEAYIGVCFVMAATASILLLANNPHGGENLRELLVGQILWVGYGDLLYAAVVSAVVLVLWFSLRDRLRGFGFYVLFAFAVTASVQLVGVYLVFASLIVPALATRNLRADRRRLGWAYAVGASGYLLGLIISTYLDLPSGAVVVWCMIGIAIAFGTAFSGRSEQG